MTSDPRECHDLFGASVAGPAHRARRQPNQDAWLKASGRFGDLIVVCDGLGSRPASGQGARLACRAVRRALKDWPGTSSGAEPADLIRLIEVLWRLHLPSPGTDDYATACRFALCEPNGTLVLAGLGDGAALVRERGHGVCRFGERPDGDFGNETLALGMPHRLHDWRIELLPPSPGRAVALASDGVADDLRADRLDGFVAWLTDEIAPLPEPLRARRLAAELRAWPVPRHTDDKTLALMIERETEQS
jgi:serine/threonine protein phosphatase PrpC